MDAYRRTIVCPGRSTSKLVNSPLLSHLVTTMTIKSVSQWYTPSIWNFFNFFRCTNNFYFVYSRKACINSNKDNLHLLCNLNYLKIADIKEDILWRPTFLATVRQLLEDSARKKLNNTDDRINVTRSLFVWSCICDGIIITWNRRSPTGGSANGIPKKA